MQVSNVRDIGKLEEKGLKLNEERETNGNYLMESIFESKSGGAALTCCDTKDSS